LHDDSALHDVAFHDTAFYDSALYDSAWHDDSAMHHVAFHHVTKGSVSYLSSPCFSTSIGGIGGPARAKRGILAIMY